MMMKKMKKKKKKKKKKKRRRRKEEEKIAGCAANGNVGGKQKGGVPQQKPRVQNKLGCSIDVVPWTLTW